jgi:hypothetical protein
VNGAHWLVDVCQAPGRLTFFSSDSRSHMISTEKDGVAQLAKTVRRQLEGKESSLESWACLQEKHAFRAGGKTDYNGYTRNDKLHNLQQ